MDCYYERFPGYIKYLLQDLKFTEDPVDVLIQYKSYTESDRKLLAIYQSLGYDQETQCFTKNISHKLAMNRIMQYNKPDDANEAKTSELSLNCDKMITNEFLNTFLENNIQTLSEACDLGLDVSECENDSLEHMWSKPASLKSSDQQSSCESIPKANKGLKFLASKVKSIIFSKGFHSYREVTDALIEELEISELLDKKKEEKNILRRVYDALNVLIAADIVVKSGKKYVWKHSGEDYNELVENRILKKKMKIEAKRDYFNDIVHKYVATHHLLIRNREVYSEERIKIPFILVATEEHPDNFIRVRANPEHTELGVSFRREIKVLGDLEVLARLNTKMHFNGLPTEVLELLRPSN